jgi:PRTRC genetic system ThiF family protein
VAASVSGCRAQLNRPERCNASCRKTFQVAAPIECTVYDDHTVSETNVGRQGFYPNDVGQHRALLLVNRIQCGDGNRVEGEARAYYGERSSRYGYHDRVCRFRACTQRDRAAADLGRCHYYLDCGNETDRGQVVLGEFGKPRHDRLPHVGDLFPELLDPKRDKGGDTPPCSMAESLRGQSLVINQAISAQAFNLLWTRFRTGALTYSAIFLSLAMGRMNPVQIDPAAWARFAYKMPPAPIRKMHSKASKKSAAAV